MPSGGSLGLGQLHQIECPHACWPLLIVILYTENLLRTLKVHLHRQLNLRRSAATGRPEAHRWAPWAHASNPFSGMMVSTLHPGAQQTPTFSICNHGS
jgi:hypothetical protein